VRVLAGAAAASHLALRCAPLGCVMRPARAVKKARGERSGEGGHAAITETEPAFVAVGFCRGIQALLQSLFISAGLVDQNGS
jgi:hypothetical protein